MDIDTVWRRIMYHQGETFHQKRGKPFTYTVRGKMLLPDTTNQLIPRLHFERALERMPIQNTAPLKDLRGPSYIYAVLADPRIQAHLHGAQVQSPGADPVLSVDLAQDEDAPAQPSSAGDALGIQLGPLPAPTAAGRQISLAGFELGLAGTIEVDRDAADRPQEAMPQARHENREGLPLNVHGRGPFCSFRVAGLEPVPGVYALVVDGAVKYIGRCENLAERFGPRGYGAIQPRNCFEGGQSTNCKINHRVLLAAQQGRSIELWFHCVREPGPVEEAAIRALKPEWNSQGVQR